MPRTKRTRALDADPEKVWALAADPAKLPRWWPEVDRVDRPDGNSFTKWVVSPRGRAVAMTFSLADLEEGRHVRWVQQLEGTPFARSLRSGAEEVTVEEAGAGSKIELVIERRMKGTARLGGLLISRGQRRELDEALDRLEARLSG
ncbi:MAG: SRPBCC family protein [Actinomycetes bacterium]